MLHQLAPDLIGIVFIYIQYNQFFGVMYRQLPADFTADGAASAGDQNHLVRHIIHDFVHPQLNRLTLQQVFNLHLAQHGYTNFPVDNLVQSRQGHYLAAGAAADFQNLLALCAGNRGNRHNDFPHMMLFCQHGNLCNRSRNRDSIEIFAYLGQVIIHQAYHLPADMLAADDFRQQHMSRVACTHNHRRYGMILLPFCQGCPGLQQKPIGKPAAHRQHKQQHRIQHHKAPGYTASQQVHTDILHHRRCRHSSCDIFQFIHTGKLPQAVIQMKQLEQQQRTAEIDRHIPGNRFNKNGINRFKAEIHAYPQRAPHADRNTQDIYKNPDRKPAIACIALLLRFG